MRPVKQVICIRKDLKLRRGKEVAQGSHASMSFMAKQLRGKKTNEIKLSEEARQWMNEGFTKVCLQIESEEQLLEIYKKALDAGLEAHLITDAGKTEFHGIPTKTCIAIGPNYSDEIDKITGDLKLY